MCSVHCRLGAGSLPKTQSSSSSIEPVGEQGSPKAPATRALTFSEMAHQISSPFGFLRYPARAPAPTPTPAHAAAPAPALAFLTNPSASAGLWLCLSNAMVTDTAYSV